MPNTINFTWFYVLDTIKGAFVPMSVSAAATADVAAPEWRATLFSLFAAELSFAFLFGAIIGGFFSATQAATVSVVLCVLNLLMALVFVQGVSPSAYIA
jgi:hypothetical protein